MKQQILVEVRDSQIIKLKTSTLGTELPEAGCLFVGVVGLASGCGAGQWQNFALNSRSNVRRELRKPMVFV